MSIRIERPSQLDPDWSVWLDTEPDAGNEICIGCGPTRDLAITSAQDSLAEDVKALINARKEGD